MNEFTKSMENLKKAYEEEVMKKSAIKSGIAKVFEAIELLRWPDGSYVIHSNFRESVSSDAC